MNASCLAARRRALWWRRQAGSILVPVVAVLIVGLVLMASADIGYMAYLKRELQKTADMAALAGAQRIEVGEVAGGCAHVAQTVDALVTQATVDSVVDVVRCGRWDGAAGLVPVPADLTSIDVNPQAWHFAETGAANAVRVTLSAQAPVIAPFLRSARQVSAAAVAAQAAPVAVFSIGSQLARFEANSLLGHTLGQVGINPQVLTLVDGNGLANLTVTPAGLLDALGIPVAADLTVGGLNELLAARTVSVGDLINAAAQVVGPERVAGLGLDALGLAPVTPLLSLQDLTLPLGAHEDGRGLLAAIVAGGASPQGALNTAIRLDELLASTLMVASFDPRLSPVPTAVGADVFSLAGVELKLRVIEPPRLGVGGIGTKAYNAQVRLSVDIDTRRIPVVSTVLGLLGDTYLHIPLHVDLIGAQAELVDLGCQDTPQTADIEVTSHILHACIASLPESELFSGQAATQCLPPPELRGEPLVKVGGLLSVRNDGVPISGLVQTQTLRFEVDQANPLPQRQRTNPSTLQLGDTVQNITGAVMAMVSKLYAPQGNSAGEMALNLADQYLHAASSGTRYDVAATVALLRQGNGVLSPVGGWVVKGGVPYACGLLYLDTCWRDGSVWDGFEKSVTGAGRGLLGGVLGTLLGGLVLEDCAGLLSQLVVYNTCVRKNLASYLQTSPTPLVDPQAGNPLQGCSTLVCQLLAPVSAALAPVLNGLGGMLSQVAGGVFGLELGRSEVELQSLGCHYARLVH